MKNDKNRLPQMETLSWTFLKLPQKEDKFSKETLVEIAWTFYMMRGNIQAIFFTKHGKFREPAWKHFVGLQCNLYLS